jgi:Tfp pilus assembly protein PilF/2-polyprenyl-3-methyl-5-hydroxy-6-metoxy-1,4-benzoquinol methylase
MPRLLTNFGIGTLAFGGLEDTTITTDCSEAQFNLGVDFHTQGKIEEAIAAYRRAIALGSNSPWARFNLGVALQAQGKIEEAIAAYSEAVALKPDCAEAFNNRGVALRELQRLDEALASYDQAIALKPDYAEALSNRGATLRELRRPDVALASYDQAIALKPDYAEAFNNRGNALRELRRPDAALASYDRAIALKPDNAEAFNNRGNALRDLQRPDEALASYDRAIALKPGYADALNNLALLLMEQGKSNLALNIIKQSLQIKETGKTKRLFVDCVKRLRLTNDDSEIRSAMIRALAEPWARPGKLARIGADLVKLNPDVGEYVARAAAAWPRRLSAQHLFESNGLTKLAADQLLCALLGLAPNSDMEIERFLTMARRLMLEAATGMAASDDAVGTAFNFYSALARQCFINEYVFCATDDEIQKANDLRDSLVVALEAKTQVPALWVLTVAAYFPLGSLPLTTRLLDTQWPKAVTAVLVQQVREPEEERQLRATIPRLTRIEDEVSRLVQNQYEENPYPRWVKAEPAGNPNSVVGFLGERFPLSSFKRHGRSEIVEFLIAGCGTGQHAIETARRFKDARVLAVDLSLSSLSYAKRKTRELGLTSIEYAQADLLELGTLGREFDVIESVGVLHHLAEPFAGWRVLLSLLCPGGFMRLGFYSEVARRHIVKARAFIAERGYGATANEIRLCRQDLVDLDKSADFGTTVNSPDFFSISTCRDLLFHSQEHRMTLTSIDAFFRDNNLAFLGFAIDGDVLHAYKQRFPDDPAATNVGQWQTFENENPDTFAGMYQFWIQKAG